MTSPQSTSKKLINATAATFLLCHGVLLGAAREVFAVERKAGIEVEWHVNKQEADDLKKFKVREPDAYETKNPIVIGLVVVVGSFVVPQIIEAFGDLWQKYRSDGFVLDTRGDKLVIEKSARIPAGQIVVVSKEGVETIRVGGPNPDPKILQEILDRVVKK